VRDACRLWHDALSVAAADEEGRLDMNLLSGGTSGAQRQFMEHVLPDLLRSLLNGENAVKYCSPLVNRRGVTQCPSVDFESWSD
jgi:hypothetical protein